MISQVVISFKPGQAAASPSQSTPSPSAAQPLSPLSQLSPRPGRAPISPPAPVFLLSKLGVARIRGMCDVTVPEVTSLSEFYCQPITEQGN